MSSDPHPLPPRSVQMPCGHVGNAPQAAAFETAGADDGTADCDCPLDDGSGFPSPAQLGDEDRFAPRHDPRRRDTTFLRGLTASLLTHTAVIAGLAAAYYGRTLETLPEMSVAAGTGAAAGSMFDDGGVTGVADPAQLPPAAVEPSVVETVDPAAGALGSWEPAMPEPASEAFLAATDFSPSDPSQMAFGLPASPISPPRRAARTARGTAGPGKAASSGSTSGATAFASGGTAGRRARSDDDGGSGDGVAAGPPAPDAANRPPRYPRGALRRRLEGTVLLRLDVLPGGGVGAVSVARSSGHTILDAAAVKAVRAWRFHAASHTAATGRVHNRCTVTLPVAFVLRPGR